MEYPAGYEDAPDWRSRGDFWIFDKGRPGADYLHARGRTADENLIEILQGHWSREGPRAHRPRPEGPPATLID